MVTIEELKKINSTFNEEELKHLVNIINLGFLKIEDLK